MANYIDNWVELKIEAKELHKMMAILQKEMDVKEHILQSFEVDNEWDNVFTLIQVFKDKFEPQYDDGMERRYLPYNLLEKEYKLAKKERKLTPDEKGMVSFPFFFDTKRDPPYNGLADWSAKFPNAIFSVSSSADYGWSSDYQYKAGKRVEVEEYDDSYFGRGVTCPDCEADNISPDDEECYSCGKVLSCGGDND